MLYRMPCGLMTRNVKRRRHNWVVVYRATDQEREFGEDHGAAVDECLRADPRCVYLLLRL